MHKFLYLTNPEWADAWVNGGPIPLSPASKYKRSERDGIFTPDENLIHESAIDLLALRPFISFGDTPNVKNFSFYGNRYNGKLLPEVKNANLYTEDGLIQSFCNVFDLDVANRMEKSACVRIFDIGKLRMLLNASLGCRAQYGDCRYTNDHQRGHFLKSEKDAWQREYRFFWPNRTETWITIPNGLSEIVWTR